MIKGLRYYLFRRKHARLIRESEIGSGDTFIVSFPKSGNTWVRFILARAMHPDKEITSRNITEFLPTMHRSSADEIRRLPSPRFIKTHAPFFSLYPRSIYISRDVRDVSVSAWFHAQRTQKYGGSLNEFLRSKLFRSFGPWWWHVEEALKYKVAHPDKMHMLRYEDLLSDPEKEITALLKFCSISTKITAADIASLTSFEKLKEQEANHGSLSMDSSGNSFFRKGRIEDWKNHFDEKTLHLLLDNKTRKTMIKLGYPVH